MGELVMTSKKKTTVYLVNHTHWDREWYFSGQDSLVLSDVLFTNAIQELEKHPKMSFTLDGQLSIFEDYLNIRPEMTGRVKQLVTTGQLKIGPWYTQPDALHVKGESLLRNGIVGRLEANKIGPTMKVGYLPDTFGFNSQLPVILNDLGLDNFVFWRGINPQKTGGFYFNWQSLSKSKSVIAIDMPQGYGTGMLLESSHKYVDDRLDPAVEFIEKNSPAETPDVLIPTGNDQMDIIHDFEKKVAQINQLGKYNYQISTYSDFINKIKTIERPDYVGEFIDPVFARIHRSCGSSRMNIKLAASHLEKKLIHEVEPLMVIGKHCGINLSNGVLVAAWKKLLKSQAHDSLAGSVVDSVAIDILQRLKEGEEIADSIINTIQRLISKNLDLSEHQILMINPLPTQVSEFQKVQVISADKNITFENVKSVYQMHQEFVEKRENVLEEVSGGEQYITEPGYYITDYLVKVTLPALGYKILNFHKENKNVLNLKNKLGTSIRNKSMEVAFDGQSLNLALSNGTNVKDFLFLEDRGNAGDTYDFSPLLKDHKIKLAFSSASVQTVGDIQQLILDGSTELPYSLEDRKAKKFNIKFSYTVKVTLSSTDRIKIQIDFDNNVADHQLTLGIKTGIEEPARASVPFGYLTRQSTEIKNWEDKFAERPINYWTFDDNVSVYSHLSYSMSVFSNDVKEYRQNDDKLLFTLLATTSQLGKPNLVNRPGRASGDTTKVGHPLIATPDAELFQKFQFKFDVCVNDSFNELAVAKQSDEIASPAISYQVQSLNLFKNRLDNKLQDGLAPDGNLDMTLSLLDAPKNLIVSACYPDYFDDSAIIVRLSNPTGSSVEFKAPLNSVAVNSLDEEIEFEGKIAPYDILTLKVASTKDLFSFTEE